MPALTSSQVDELLSRPIVARLASVKPDGAPYVVPVWQHWDGSHMYIVPRARSRFVEFLKRDNRVAVSCADDSSPKQPRVLLEGTAEIVEGPVLMSGRLLEIAREMAHRYRGGPGLEYLESTMDKPRYLVRITPTKTTTWAGSWHPRYG